MSRHTSFRIGGNARFFAQPSNDDELRLALDFFASKGEKIYMLGGGTNLLVRDEGVDGAVISMRGGWKDIQIDRDDGTVKVGAGAALSALVKHTVEAGLAGLEGLAGIPGTVGGALVMNAGGKYGNIGDVVTSVRMMDKSGKVIEFSAAQMKFAYRSSAVGDRIVLDAKLKLTAKGADELKRTMHRVLEEKRTSQPLSAHSAGCVFRNPEGQSAGALIDKLGLKGMRVGGAMVSPIHANFIVNAGGATAADVIELIERIREKVRSQTGIELELEIKIW